MVEPLEQIESLSSLLINIEDKLTQFETLQSTAKGNSTGTETKNYIKNLKFNLYLAQQNVQGLAAQLEQIRAFIRTSALITSSLDIEQVLQEVIDTIITLTGTTRGYLMLRQESDGELSIQIARNWNQESLSEKEIIFSQSVVQKVLTTWQPLVTNSAQTHNLLKDAESVQIYGLNLILCIPLIYRETLIGVIYVDSSNNVSDFDFENITLLSAFANQAVSAIENAKLFNQVKSDLERAQWEIQRLRIQEVTLTAGDVLPKLVETIAQLLSLPYAAITFHREPDSETIVQYGVLDKEKVSMPLRYSGEVVGELILSQPTNRLFSENERYLLNEFLHEAGSAVQSVRLMLDLQRSRERLVTAREEERRRLRRDLHDGLGPTLASITLTLDAARNLLKRDVQAADNLLLELTTQVQSAIGDIRRVVYELRPPTLDELGLVPAIRQQIMQYSHQQTLNISLTATEPLMELPAAIEVAAYRIVQEALTNAIRHAQAHNCSIHILARDNLTLEICDDGIGLPDHWQPGVGITSMRERAAELGGYLVIESAAPTGLRIVASLPLQAR